MTYVEIMDKELEYVLNQLREQANLAKPEELVSDKLQPTIVVDKGTWCGQGVHTILYSNLCHGRDRDNLINLEADVERCLEHYGDVLKPGWRDRVIRPLLDYAARKITDNWSRKK